MADAFGLAVNILTVLEFGRKFAILAWNIYEDGKDRVPRVSSLDFTSKDLAGVARKLGEPGSLPAAHRPDETDESIRQLAKRCAKVVAQMQGTISDISTHKSHRKISKAMVQAFKYKWKQDEIEAFQKEIEDLRSQLMLNLSIGLRNGMTMSLENQDAMVKELADSEDRDQDLKKRLDYLARQQEGFAQLMVEILSSIATPAVSHKEHERHHASMETDLMDAMNHAPQSTSGEDSTRLQISPQRLKRIQRQFISIFRYDSMFDRQTGVTEAHEVTLKWIFNERSGEAYSWHNFREWLESDNQLYWITGKMGSGKSTLMKYISQELPTTGTAGTERRCTPYLLRCAKDKPLFIATFYFWAGTNDSARLQTSTEGLYRTILTQLLEVYPEAAPYVSPRRWEILCLFNKNSEPPRATELESMVTSAVRYVSSIAKVCLFIDGLDEFEGVKDDRKGLVEWVKRLTETLPVKLCVASRPWRVFEDALQDRPHLLMESFNSKDIHKYVSTRFLEDPHFGARKRIEAALCDELVDEIVAKAEGVFLWVYLVCTSLLEAMSEGDLMGRLRQILKQLPVEMEKLYDHIFDNLDPSYQDHAAQYFFLMEVTRNTPDALIFSFADDIGEDSDFAITMPKRSLTQAELQYRVNELRKRLNSRCRGLLSLAVETFNSGYTVTPLQIGTVQYCHRSVKDYLTMKTIQKRLTDMLEVPFDPHLRLCSAYLARWKRLANPPSKRERSSIIFASVHHAAEVAGENSTMLVRLLDDLDTDLGDRLDLSELQDHDDSIRFAWFGGTFLSLAVALDVIEYVKHKVRHGQGCVVKSSSVYFAMNSAWEDDCRGMIHEEYGRPSKKDKERYDSMEEHLEPGMYASQVEWPLSPGRCLCPKPDNGPFASREWCRCQSYHSTRRLGIERMVSNVD